MNSNQNISIENYNELDKKYHIILKKYNTLNKRFNSILKIGDNQFHTKVKELDISSKKNKRIDVILKQGDKEGKKILDEKYYLEDELRKELDISLASQKLMMQQAKMAAMGEMLESISYQWRQPLSVITTASSGMKLQNEHGLLNDNVVNDSCDSIYDSAEYLSQTINDFRSFFNQDKQKVIFDIKDIYNNTFKLLIAKFKNRNIKVYNTLNTISISGSENELIQVLMNILNNATDALESKENDKLIFIEIYQENNEAIIKIKDNARGIPQDILSKIFDAHFTTKQNTNATGIGLYMSQKIILDSFKGTIEVNNIDYEYDGKDYTGAEFVITLPLSHDILDSYKAL